MGGTGDAGIDKTQHIKLKQVVDYLSHRPDRRAFDHNNSSFFARFPHFIDRLAAPSNDGGLGIIDEHQRYAAVEIILLHDVALKKLDIASLREFSHWFDWGEGPRHPETVYIRVMRALPRQHSAMIERLCFQPVRPSDYAWIERQAHNIQQAFNGLGQILSDQKARIRKELEDETGKSFDEICRERYQTHLAKVALDKDSINKNA